MPEIEKIEDETATDSESQVAEKEEPKQAAENSNESTTSTKTAAPDTEDNHSTNARQRTRVVATSTSLFVTGFASAIHQGHLDRLFSKFGRPERITNLMQKKTSAESRYCFVEYDTIENAQKAIDNLNGRVLAHRRLLVRPAHSKPTDQASGRTSSVPMNPAKEKVLLDKKIAALKKKIRESQKTND
jgi:RNA recognition motif-containing protein